MIDKTIMIYDTQTDPLVFMVFKGDLRKYDGIYMNKATDSDKDQALQDSLQKNLYDEAGNFKAKTYKKFPVASVTPTTAVIVCGFLP